MCNIQWNNKDINFLIKTHNNTYFTVDNRYRKSSTTYVIGDIIYSRNLSNSYRLECVASGTSASTEPIYSSPAAWQYVQDGTCTWIIDDIRDSTQVGMVKPSIYLPNGYVKLEGGIVNRKDYPRLVNLANTYSLWTSNTTENPGLFGEGNGSTTMVLLNWVGHMAQFASSAGGKVDAGLPNITGDFGGASFRPYDLATMGIAPSGAFFKSSTFQGNYTKLGSPATVWEFNSLTHLVPTLSTTITRRFNHQQLMFLPS